MDHRPLLRFGMSVKLSGPLLLRPHIYNDDRGFFFESYNKRQFEKETGVSAEFVQDNHSHSRRGVLRGLHYQLPHPQGKLVRVVSGEIFDVIVDLRKSSPTFGKWEGFRLEAARQGVLWIPAGFAHGFLTLSDAADVNYKTTDYYDPASEQCLRWDDPDVAIAWPLNGTPILSEKDRRGKSLNELSLFV